MVCSNETLKMAIDNLKVVVAENTTEQKATRQEQQETRSSLDKLSATFETWQKTKCGDHETKIFRLEKRAEKTDARINRGGGAIALVLFLMQAAVLFFKVTGGP